MKTCTSLGKQRIVINQKTIFREKKVSTVIAKILDVFLIYLTKSENFFYLKIIRGF